MRKAILKEFNSYYQFQNTPNNIRVVFTNRRLNLGFINHTESQIKTNRQIILSELHLGLDQLVCAEQTHGSNAYVVEQKDAGRGATRYKDAVSDTDALITKEKNIALSVFVADCLPVFIIDKKEDIIALAHCGWKSTSKSLLKKTISTMQQKFGSKPQNSLVFFGPVIRKCCFQVGEEFSGYFREGICRREGKVFLDLIQVNCLQAKEAGIIEDNIFDSEICTYCQNDKFFSFRKEESASGRQMALITRKER